MSSENSPAKANTPVHSIRKHSLKASIWRNETSAGVIYNVTLIRTFRNGDGFRDTSSLGFNDLSNAAKLLLDAESWITWKTLRDKADAGNKPPEATQGALMSDSSDGTEKPKSRKRRNEMPD